MKKILIVDDSATVLAMMAAVLKKAGYDIATAATTADGLAKTKEWKPELVLLDVMLPDESGFTLLTKIKTDEGCKDIAVAMLTGQDSPTDVAKGTELGAIGYLVKHATMPKILVEKVKGWIGQ